MELRRAGTRLRERFRPAIASSLEEVGLRPANVPERVASKKLVEELLDQIVERDFLTMSDLRDGISRNNLKLPDLESGRQFFSGDQLLEADRRLGQSLGRRLSSRRGLSAAAATPEFAGLRHRAGPHAGALLGDSLWRRVFDPRKASKHLILLIAGGFQASAGQASEARPGRRS